MGRSSSESTRSRCRSCSRDLSQADVEILGFHVFAGSQNLDAEIISEAQRATVELVIELAQSAPAPDHATSISAAASGSRTSTVTHPLDLGLVGENLATLLDERIRPSLPEARVVDRARAVHRW